MEQLGGDRPRRRSARRCRRELWLAMLRRCRTAIRISVRQPHPLLQSEYRRGYRPSLRLQPRRAGGRRRGMRHRQLRDFGSRLLPGRVISDRIQRGAVLFGLQPEVHLGDVPGRQWRPGSSRARDLRRGRGGARRSPHRTRWRSLLRGLRWRHHPTHRIVHPPADGCDSGQLHVRVAPTHRAVRRLRLHVARPGCGADLCLGSRRRRRVRRLRAVAAAIHVHDGRNPNCRPSGHRSARLERNRVAGDPRRQHASERQHRHSDAVDDLERR